MNGTTLSANVVRMKSISRSEMCSFEQITLSLSLSLSQRHYLIETRRSPKVAGLEKCDGFYVVNRLPHLSMALISYCQKTSSRSDHAVPLRATYSGKKVRLKKRR
jgi:hypothetical protein